MHRHVDQTGVAEEVVVPDQIQQQLRVKTWPGRRASSSSRRNSVAVSATSRPCRRTTKLPGSISRLPTSMMVDGALVFILRSSERTRATNSGRSKGLRR